MPGLDFAQHVIKTLTENMLSQSRTYNDAWNKIENGQYDLKDLLADSVKIYRNQFEAYRGVLTFGVRSVEWKQVKVKKGQVVKVDFDQPTNVPFGNLAVSRADRTGGPGNGSLTLSLRDEHDATLHVDIVADKKVVTADQWIAFVYDKTGGSPLGALLIFID